LEGEEEGEESETEEGSPTESGDDNTNSQNAERTERKDGLNGTQAANIDAGRCNDCPNANSDEKSDKRKKRGLCSKQGEERGELSGIRKKIKKNGKNNRRDEEGEEMHQAVAVNCRWGKGRTGTMISCYLVHKEGLTAYEAICKVRGLSAGSLETKGQEEFVEEFYRLKMLGEGRESDYQRSLPYPFIPETRPNTRTIVVNNPAIGGGAAASSLTTANGVIYGRHEPAATQAGVKKAAGSNKICWNNSLLLAKMHK